MTLAAALFQHLFPFTLAPSQGAMSCSKYKSVGKPLDRCLYWINILNFLWGVIVPITRFLTAIFAEKQPSWRKTQMKKMFHFYKTTSLTSPAGQITVLLQRIKLESEVSSLCLFLEQDSLSGSWEPRHHPESESCSKNKHKEDTSDSSFILWSNTVF